MSTSPTSPTTSSSAGINTKTHGKVIEGKLLGRKLEVLTEEYSSPKQRAANLVKAIIATLPSLGFALLSKTVRNLWKSGLRGSELKKFSVTIDDDTEGRLREVRSNTASNSTIKKVNNTFSTRIIEYQNNKELFDPFYQEYLDYSQKVANKSIKSVIEETPSYIKFISAKHENFEILAHTAVQKDPSAILVVDQADNELYRNLVSKTIDTLAITGKDPQAAEIYRKLPNWTKVDLDQKYYAQATAENISNSKHTNFKLLANVAIDMDPQLIRHVDQTDREFYKELASIAIKNELEKENNKADEIYRQLPHWAKEKIINDNPEYKNITSIARDHKSFKLLANIAIDKDPFNILKISKTIDITLYNELAGLAIENELKKENNNVAELYEKLPSFAKQTSSDAYKAFYDKSNQNNKEQIEEDIIPLNYVDISDKSPYQSDEDA